MVFGIGANDSVAPPSDSRRDTGPSSFPGGSVGDDGTWSPPVSRTPYQMYYAEPSQVYLGDMFIPGSRPRQEPILKDRYEASFENWQQITRDPDMYGALTQAYNIAYRKPANYRPNLMQLQSFHDSVYTDAARLAGQKVTPQQVLGTLLNPAMMGITDPFGEGRKGAYTGPRESITVMAESDINATANALALEMIGRPLNDKELARVTRRIRGAEMEQPQVTTGTAARTVTEQGLTAQGREDILRAVIASRPEYEQYQVDTTVLDTMLSEFKKREQMVNG